MTTVAVQAEGASVSSETIDDELDFNSEQSSLTFRGYIERFKLPVHSDSRLSEMDRATRASRSRTTEAQAEVPDSVSIKTNDSQKANKQTLLDSSFTQPKKRKNDIGAGEEPAKKVRTAKPTPTPAKPIAVNNLKDSIREGLILISIGLNPGLQTGRTGMSSRTIATIP